MSRNDESRFALNPQVEIQRSRFERNSSVKTSFNVGDVVPFYLDEVLPGDTLTVDTSKVVRLQTLLTPVMDNMYLDTYYFFVPNRLVWEHWVNLMGENTESAWVPETEYSVPQTTAPDGGWSVGTIADYFGIPTGVEGLSVNSIPFRAYSLIINDWFRDQNVQDPVNINKGDATTAGSNDDNYIIDLEKGGKPFIASKFADQFTTALPSPQKGEGVDLPIALSGLAPVYALNKSVPDWSGSETLSPMGFNPLDPDWQSGVLGSITPGSGGFLPAYNKPQFANYGSFVMSGRTGLSQTGINLTYSQSDDYNLTPDNLFADVSLNAEAVSINTLRLAFATQRLLERDARGGTRYIESIYSHFRVTNPDYRLQRPEYLGGNRVPITINQILQQSETANTPQGTPTGQSLTTDVHSDFTKSFTEHGFVIGLMVARYNHTYQQGLARMWSRRSRLDYYFPVFANIGEQPIYNREIYATGGDADSEVFGYNEAWYEYRYKPNIVTGEMRSQYAQSLDVWHFADYYNELPILSDEWMREDKNNVDRTLAVSSELSNQLFADIYIQNTSVRPMPLFSIPGLLDHN